MTLRSFVTARPVVRDTTDLLRAVLGARAVSRAGLSCKAEQSNARQSESEERRGDDGETWRGKAKRSARREANGRAVPRPRVRVQVGCLRLHRVTSPRLGSVGRLRHAGENTRVNILSSEPERNRRSLGPRTPDGPRAADTVPPPDLFPEGTSSPSGARR